MGELTLGRYDYDDGVFSEKAASVESGKKESLDEVMDVSFSDIPDYDEKVFSEPS